MNLYKAIVKDIVIKDDMKSAIIKVEFSNDVNTFEKEYNFTLTSIGTEGIELIPDIETSFNATLESEVNRINELKSAFPSLVTKIGKIYGN